MGAWLEILLGVVLFTAIILVLVGGILLARALLVREREVRVLVNRDRPIRSRSGTPLSEALAEGGILLPAACGGRGTCGGCRVRVVSAGSVAGPADMAVLGAGELRSGERLACQLRLSDDLEVEVHEDFLAARRVECTVRSNTFVGSFIKELVLALPPGESFEHRAGAYVRVTCPPYQASFADLEIPDRYRADWRAPGLLALRAGTPGPESRAYSLANRPGERDVLVLVVRIAVPPPHLPEAPPGVVSSWIFQLRPGDRVEVDGPYGHFVAEDSPRELLLVGGGAGMAPMRAHAFEQLERFGTRRPLSFWYGARSRRELLYVEEFDRLAAEHDNFSWTVALSEPRPDDHWTGPVGFIHEVLLARYLRTHPDPAACEYYICGPPMMVLATRSMLSDLGVDPADVHADDFGAAR